ncbi:hypothetical protein PIB30_069614 [Stylosanthes scabra]|uniref:Uncharacterized protein n=1 Tax=Stylosanthes scabra TaxID=79078 RepID=A0ABU6TMX8_9FABA|nr:hypothetical protein [Stylosanthes scabra]
MDAKVTRSSPSVKIRKGMAESTQKGGTGRFGVAATFAGREPCLDSFRLVFGLLELTSCTERLRHASFLMKYYEIKKCEKYEDSDKRADSDLAVMKTRRYHFDDEIFIHPLHRVQFDPDRPYELPVESILALKRRNPSKKKDSTPQGSGLSRSARLTPQYSPLFPVTRIGSPSSPPKMVPPIMTLKHKRYKQHKRTWYLF